MPKYKLQNKHVTLICTNAYNSTSDLKGFIRACQGMFPLQILEVMKQLNLSTEPLLHHANSLQNDTKLTTNFSSFINSTWDFTPESSGVIADEILSNETKILSLGAPSIFNQPNKIKESSKHVLIDLGKIEHQINLM